MILVEIRVAGEFACLWRGGAVVEFVMGVRMSLMSSCSSAKSLMVVSEAGDGY